jgi:hypothetical protein
MNTDNNSFDPTPRLKSSPLPILFIPFNKDDNKCHDCGNKYSKTLDHEQKYCKNCLSQYIKNTTCNNIYLDLHIITNKCDQCESLTIGNCTKNTQEWCKYCSEVSYFRQIIPNTSLFNSYYFYGICTHNKIVCESCDKCWSSYLFEHGQDCYQISSGWVESTLTKKSIPIINLPWYDNHNKCAICLLKLKYVQDPGSYSQKWCRSCRIIYTVCRYCLTTNMIFGITDQSQCKKCKRISFITIDITDMSSGNCAIDEFIFSRIDNNNHHSIANYINNDPSSNPLKVYNFIRKLLYSKIVKIEWIPSSQIKNLRKIAEGGFSTTYRAIWSSNNYNFDVAIKRLFNSQNINKYFLNEVRFNI